MSKHEAPPFRMIIERGKLVPATPYDAERLDTYRTGTPIKVRLVEEKDRILVRKWFAVIGRAVKECATPWKTKDEASEAIKLALGIVNLTKTVGGEFLAYPKSLTELTDPELEEAVEQMLAVLYRITGVDPDDWRKHIADIGEDEPVSDHPPSPSETAGSASDNPTSPGHSDDATDPAMPVEAGAEGQEQSEPAPASEYSRAACIKAFMRTATDKDLSIADRRDILEQSKDWWKENLPADLDFVRACLTTADKVAKGELQEGPARKYLEGLL